MPYKEGQTLLNISAERGKSAFEQKKEPTIRTVWLWVAFFGLGILKLAIVWGNETVTEGSDSFLYMTYAAAGFWGADHFPFRGPGFPLWIMLNHALHIPLRLGIEALYIFGSAILAAGLFKLRFHWLIALGAFVGLVFNPSSFYELDQPMSEGFFASLFFITFGCYFFLIGSVNWRYRVAQAALVGLGIAALIHTRGNDTVLILSFAAVAALGYGIVAVVRVRRMGYWRTEIVPVVAAGLAFAVLHLGVLTANYAVYKSFDVNEIVSKGQQALLNALVRIDTGEPEIHGYIPVTNESLRIAYDLSPTLRAYRPAIEEYRLEHDASAYTTFSRTGISGQFDIQSIIVITETIVVPRTGDAAATKPGEARDSLHYAIADEIKAGLADGKAKSRPVVYIWPILSGNLYLNALRSAARLSADLFQAQTAPILDNYPFYGSLVSPIYNEFARRRLDLVRKGPMKGYIAVPAGDVPVRVEFRNDTVAFFASQGAPHYVDGMLVNLRAAGLEPYDLMGEAHPIPVADEQQIPQDWKAQVPDGMQFFEFELPPVNDRFNLYFGRLDIALESGSTGVVRELQERTQLSSDEAAAPALVYITDFPVHLSTWQHTGYWIQSAAFNGYNAMAAVVSGLLLLSAVGWRFFGPKNLHSHPSYARVAQWTAAALLLVVIFQRIALYAFLDVTIVPVNDGRHLYAGSIFFVPALLVCCYLISGQRVGRLTSTQP